MRRIGEHAVVIGGSMAGLLAARALSGPYERVTVIDRDTLPDGLEGRKGVPQGRHTHGLLPHGQVCLDVLLPGLTGELVADGAATAAALQEMRYVVGGHELARPATGRHAVLASRPFIEGHVRRRVRALPDVAVIDRCDALGLILDGGRERVTGVRILRRADGSAEEALDADLVVAATGRAARVPAWLDGLGFAAPAEERVAIDVAYATRRLRLPGGDKLILITAAPGRPRALFLFAQEHGDWILSVGGYGPDHRPPLDPDGFDAFVATVAPHDVRAALEEAEPLSDPIPYGFPASVRRRYERLRRFPAGLLVCGDAVASFNPTFGQGMTVAAAQAVALRACLEHGERRLASRFFAAAARPVAQAWNASTGTDLAQPGVEGRPPLTARALGPYLGRLRATAAQDPAVAEAFIAVSGMREPPSHLLRPGIVARVVRGAAAVEWREGGAGVRHGELTIDGVRTPLREAGPAAAREAVVFLHGNPGSGADWEPLLRTVGARWRALAWDAPGFGRSATPAGFTQTVQAHAAFVGRALNALGVERAHVVAHDFGGPFGLTWAATDPERFASAVLIGTGALPGYRWHALARLWRTPAAGELFMATTTRRGFGLLLRRGNQRGLPRPFLDRMYDDFDPPTRRAVLELYRSVADVGAAGEQLAAALAPLDRPALVLWGRHDPYLPVEHAERQRAAFPRAQVRVLDAGHWPFVEQPGRVAAALTAFLAEHTSGVAAAPGLDAAAPTAIA